MVKDCAAVFSAAGVPTSTTHARTQAQAWGMGRWQSSGAVSLVPLSDAPWPRNLPGPGPFQHLQAPLHTSCPALCLSCAASHWRCWCRPVCCLGTLLSGRFRRWRGHSAKPSSCRRSLMPSSECAGRARGRQGGLVQGYRRRGCFLHRQECRGPPASELAPGIKRPESHPARSATPCVHTSHPMRSAQPRGRRGGDPAPGRSQWRWRRPRGGRRGCGPGGSRGGRCRAAGGSQREGSRWG
jgi:hypothetical protein